MDQVVLEKVLAAPIELVWKVITEESHMKYWYFDFRDQWKLELGHEFNWTAGDNVSKEWLHHGKMMAIIAEKKLSHTWEYPGYSGSSLLTWELESVSENKTKLTLFHQFIVPFDPTVEPLQIHNFRAGWDAIIHTSLTAYLEKLN